MISPIAIYFTSEKQLCTDDDPRQAFLIVGKGCYIEDWKAKMLGLQEFIESVLKSKPIQELDSIKIVDPKTKKRGGAK